MKKIIVAIFILLEAAKKTIENLEGKAGQHKPGPV